MDYNIRMLHYNDFNQFYTLIKQFRETIFSESEFKEQLKKIERYSEIWVIEINKKIIATGTLIYEQKFIFNLSKLAHIEDICVDLEYRNKGYGKNLINFLINRAKEKGCYKITLNCNVSNKEFYTKCNLEERGLQMCKLL